MYGSRPNVPDFVIRGGQTYRIIADHLGSPRMAVNVNNLSDIPYRVDHSATGVVTALGTTSPAWLPFGFAGGMYDHATGFVRFGARDYDPTIGRWISKDPSRFRAKGTNLYAYVENDPVNRLDPSGNDWRGCLGRLNAARSLVSIFDLAGAFDSISDRERNFLADDLNRQFYEDASHTQSQDTYEGGQSIDASDGGMSSNEGGMSTYPQ